MAKNKLYSRFEKLFILGKKSIYIAWYRHHFLIPPRSMYKYVKSFFTNVKRGNGTSNMYTNQKSYKKWYEVNMKNLTEDEIVDFEYKPKFSFVVPCYNTKPRDLKACLDSLLDQSYKNYEVVVCDDASDNKETLEALKQYDDRVLIIHHKDNQMISAATNTAIENASGEFLVFVDNDDVVHRDALYFLAQALNNDRTIDFLYTDEDKIEFDGSYIEPHFKPDYAPDSFLTLNYINHLTCARKSIVNKVGGFRSAFDGAQDYDLYLRIFEITDKIYHVNKVLYHWRVAPNSTADIMDNKAYALETGRKAVEDALQRRKIKGTVTINPLVNSNLVKYDHNNPLVSIVIPMHDGVEVTKRCIDSLYNKNTYKNFEIILANNRSQDKETYDYFDKLCKSHNNIKIVNIDEEFNYSRINNLAVKQAKGDFLLLLNNDTEVITPDFIDWMLGYASQKHIGCVGIKLLYPNDYIQHAGVVLGYGGVAGHIYVSFNDDELGIFGRLVTPSNFSCVTAACLMIDKKKFNEVNGFDENIKVALNDVDLCLKELDAGYYNVCLNNVSMYHYESKSRGYDASKEKHERYLAEQKYVKNKWKDKLKVDKFFSEYYF